MKTILLIEDNVKVRENTAEILELSNYNVLTAQNGKIGVELAKNNLPDLIICDIMMPELDGYGVFHILSKSDDTASIPFIFLTAKAEKADIRKGMNLGADDYLTKPFDDTELLDTIEIRLHRNELIRKNSSSSIGSVNEIASESKGLKELENLIFDQSKVNKYKKKQIIYSEGNISNSLYYIKKGKVKTYKTNDDGRDYIVGLHKEGDFIGYFNLLKDSVYSDSAATLEDTEICVIPKHDFFELLYSNINIAEKFIKIFSSDLIESEERLIKLAYNSVRKRVAESLLMLKKNHKDNNSEGNFSMSVPREDLAAITGASKETVVRTLSDFKDEKIIEINGSVITILNESKLENMRN